MAASRLFKARWLFPVASEPISHGAIEVGGGRILAVHRRPPGKAEDLGEVAIVPGFVNAHTHLEFSELPAPLSPGQPFPTWIRALMAYRRQRGEATGAVRSGLDECRQNGTVAFGEIVTEESNEAPANVVGAVLFRELIGFTPESIDVQSQIANRFLQSDGSDFIRGAIRGISPHAPYSVHPKLFQQLVALAARHGVPLAMHLAETQAELQLLREGKGELVELLTAFGVWREGTLPPATRPLDYLQAMAALNRVVIAHGNYLDDEEIDFVASRRNFAVVYCPRTHAFFGHAEHPWRKIIARGGLVAIGTDGRCSNPDLSVWNELLYLAARFPDCDRAMLLQMGTLNGARALGLETELGTLESGKVARTAIVRLGDSSIGDPYVNLFHPASRVERLLVD